MLKNIKYLITILLCILLPLVANESDGILYKFQYYKDNNVVDVLTNTVSVNKSLGHKLKLNVNFLADAITGASRKDNGTLDGTTSASEAVNVDAMTSASQTDETRRQIGGSLSLVNDFIKHFRKDKNSDDPTTLSLIGSYSDENDYTSKTVTIAFAQDMFQRNTTLGLVAGRSFDNFHPAQRFIPGASDKGWNYLGNGDRLTDRISVSITQGITVTTVAQLILGYGYDRGYLSRPYYSYNFDNVILAENLPAQRNSRTMTLLINQYIPILKGSSIQLNYRLYQDNWNLVSNTIDAKIFFRVAERFIVRPSYRFYNQTAAFFYRDEYTKDEFPNGPQYLTTDFKYREGMTNSFGLKLIYEIKDFVKPESNHFLTLFPTSFDVSFDYYIRESTWEQDVRRSHYSYWPISKGFRAFYIEAGATFAF